MPELDELVGIVRAGRMANPDAEVETVGDLYRLGEQAINEDIDRDLGSQA